MRKLASIQKIKNLQPIKDADAIEVASVLGWNVVVKKGEFQVGDLVVYCEIDSILPDKPEFEFLRNKKFRIRTLRLRGQVSQGICFPLSILPKDFEVEEGKECTEELGIIKYEPPIPASLGGIAKGIFPTFIPKTDETRIQILQDLLDKYEGTTCYITEKLDGSSATYFLKDGQFGVCSRNLELVEDENNTFWKVARETDLENKMRSLGKNIALQGELIGEGIQKNKLKLKGQKVMYFNAFDIDKYSYYDLEELKELLNDFDLPIVPILSETYKLSNNIEEIVELATIKSSMRKETWAEGIVIRPLRETRDLNGRVSFKAISPKFLLKYDD